MVTLSNLVKAEKQFYRAEAEAWENNLLPKGEDRSDKTLQKKSIDYRLRNRLFLLGYLPNSDARNSNLKNGLEQFQREAGLQHDDHLKERTTELLDLCTHFEQEPGKRIKELPEKIRYRVAALRLKAYGLAADLFPYSKKNRVRKTTISLIENAFRDFCAVIQALGLNFSPDKDENDNYLFKPQGEMFRLLMRHNTIVEHLAGFEDVVTSRHIIPNHSRQKDREATLQKFVRHIASVELWLNGYNSSPISTVNGNENKVSTNSLNDAINDFWRDQFKENTPKLRSQKQYYGILFRTLLQYDPSKKTKIEEVDADALEDALEEFNAKPELKPELEKSVKKNFGALIWDGIKRAIRGVINFLKGLVRKARNLIRNLTRILRNLAPRTYDYIADVIRALSRCVGFLFSSQPKFANDCRVMQIKKSIDGDIRLLSCGHDPIRAVKITKLMRITAQSLQNSTFIFGSLLNLFVKILNPNWLSLIITLTRMGAKWRNYRTAFNELRYTGDQIELLESALRPSTK